MSLKVGGKARIVDTEESVDYCSRRYVCTVVEIIRRDAPGVFRVKAFDNKMFTCPESFLEEYQTYGYVKVCCCGALATYGTDNCTGLHHAFYCDMRKDV